jgi:hypothetical protein
MVVSLCGEPPWISQNQLLLGRSKPESILRYLGIEVDDALEMAEQTEV